MKETFDLVITDTTLKLLQEEMIKEKQRGYTGRVCIVKVEKLTSTQVGLDTAQFFKKVKQ